MPRCYDDDGRKIYHGDKGGALSHLKGLVDTYEGEITLKLDIKKRGMSITALEQYRKE